ncbi:transcription initiation factor IIA subunit 2 [Drosophila ficusphila]|uniref:transcription initiation factor IIA subunit 2 n=1 Tax=Drosophila ficusphila TaxID=30025 RepID=UPI0007E898B1|nr:transcription initiation factor IIA subunit 2 [Drosophila ficusphila]
MTYQHYRSTTLGNTLQETLDEMLQSGQITPNLTELVLAQYDKSINEALKTKVKAKVNFSAGKFVTYRLCDNVWRLDLQNVEFREGQEVVLKVDAVKVVACMGTRD